MKIYYSSEYECLGYGVDTTEKARDLIESLQRRPIKGVEVVVPEPATPEQLITTHQRAYVNAIMTGSPSELADRNGLGDWSPDLRRSVIASVGGVISATRTALTEHKHVGSASSGLHHARFAFGSGFCTLNGLAIAARVALLEGAKRVLIIDLDAHCGGGTASLIRGVKGIEQVDVSVSRFDHYESGENVSLTMSSGETYLDDIREALRSVDSPSSIDVVLYNAGMDPHEDCHTGGTPGVTTEVLAEREQLVFEWANDHNIPVAFVLAGGYSNSVLTRDDLVDLHRLTVKQATL